MHDYLKNPARPRPVPMSRRTLRRVCAGLTVAVGLFYGYILGLALTS
jgi:hypothetical protein